MDEPKENLGGGSGGGISPDHLAHADGVFEIEANQVKLVSQPPIPPAEPDPCIVTVEAVGLEPEDGLVNVRGTAGVRITSGPVEDSADLRSGHPGCRDCGVRGAYGHHLVRGYPGREPDDHGVSGGDCD